MPTWIAYILGAAALVTALGVLWKKVVQPALNFVVAFVVAEREMLPLLQELTEVFKDTPHAFAVLDELVSQVRTNDGSSLRDAINRIEAASDKAAALSESLKIGVKAAELLAGIDRDKLQTLALMLDRVGVRVDAGAATGLRNENRAIGVAEDLAASQHRADQVESTEAGAAADVAALPPMKPTEP